MTGEVWFISVVEHYNVTVCFNSELVMENCSSVAEWSIVSLVLQCDNGVVWSEYEVYALWRSVFGTECLSSPVDKH